MSVNSSAFKLFSCVNAYKNILSNRIVFASPQPQAGIKQSSKTNIDLSDFPTKPPRPLTPYFKFLAEHRSLVKKEHPELGPLEIIKMCAIDWKNVHESIKERYSDQYKQEMEVYSKHYLDYQGKLTPEQKEKLSQIRKEKIEAKKKTRLRKKYKDSNRPKRPLAPYFLFTAEKAKERNLKYNELAVTLKDEWKNLSESEKQRYSDEFNKNVKEYKEAMKVWENDMIKNGHFDLVRGRALIERGLKTNPQHTKFAKRNIKKVTSESDES